jgi:hypothetical protein
LEIVQYHEKNTGKNEDVRYKKVWRRSEKKEQVKENQVLNIILTGFAVV